MNLKQHNIMLVLEDLGGKICLPQISDQNRETTGIQLILNHISDLSEGQFQHDTTTPTYSCDLTYQAALPTFQG